MPQLPPLGPRPADPCCAKCRTPFGVCGSKGSCTHHEAARDKQDMWDLQAADRDYLRYSTEATKVRVVR